MENTKLKPSAFAVQLWATFCICFLASQTGFVCAWPSSTIAMFQSNNTLLSHPMSSFEVSLLGSLPNAGALVATPFCGYVFNTFGRKYGTILFALPYVLGWTIVSLSTNVIAILIAMTIAGFGIAGQNVSLIYISEISHDSIRGAMTASSATGYILGILVSYAFGGYLTYYQGVYANLTLSVVSILLLMLLRESPAFLVLVGKEEEAAKSIAFYNRVAVDSKEVEVEIRRIKIQLDPRLEKMLEAQNDPEVSSGLLAEELGTETMDKTESAWKFLRQSKSSKRALTVTVVTMLLSTMMGGAVFQIYAEPLFTQSVPSLSANLCSIMLAVNFLIANFVCLALIDRCGRRMLMLTTALGSGISILLLATQLQFDYASRWFTVSLIFAYNFIFPIGCGVIPFVLSAEVFLPEVRSLCNSIVLGTAWISLFLMLFIFYPLVNWLGFGGVCYIFASVCFIGTIYVYYKLPETKGLSADAIQGMFLKNK